MKENNVPLYVHTKSNHPPTVIANIPLGINKRLNSISASKEVFESAAPQYQQALTKSGYQHQLTYQPPINCQTKKLLRSDRQHSCIKPLLASRCRVFHYPPPADVHAFLDLFHLKRLNQVKRF